MSLYNGPPRPGARGGRDQFNWENVKSDKDREFYLGHSVKATVGRWQKGKDVFWYTREKNENGIDPRDDEIALVKQREEELMMEALGMKPKAVRPKAKPQLSQMEMKQLLDGHPAEQEAEEDEEGKQRDEADRIKGVGYRSGQIMGSGGAEREVMAGVGLNRQQPGNPTGGSVPGSALPLPPEISASELKKLRKAQGKDAKKAEKKAQKKAKKEAKKAKKEQKAAKRKQREKSSPSSSPSEASDSDRQPQKRRRNDSSDEEEVPVHKPASRRQSLQDKDSADSPPRRHASRHEASHRQRSPSPPHRRQEREYERHEREYVRHRHPSEDRSHRRSSPPRQRRRDR